MKFFPPLLFWGEAPKKPREVRNRWNLSILYSKGLASGVWPSIHPSIRDVNSAKLFYFDDSLCAAQLFRKRACAHKGYLYTAILRHAYDDDVYCMWVYTAGLKGGPLRSCAYFSSLVIAYRSWPRNYENGLDRWLGIRANQIKQQNWVFLFCLNNL